MKTIYVNDVTGKKPQKDFRVKTCNINRDLISLQIDVIKLQFFYICICNGQLQKKILL